MQDLKMQDQKTRTGKWRTNSQKLIMECNLLISRQLILFELHYTGVIVNYDYVCDINVCETVMFTPMRLY